MNEVMIKNDINIENLIYEIRGVQVMLDSDLALLYQVETKRINEAVYRNKEKFPERFSFRVTEEEYSLLRSQISTSRLNMVVEDMVLGFLQNNVLLCLQQY